MKAAAVVCVFFLAFPVYGSAQERTIPDAELRDLSKSLAEMQDVITKAQLATDPAKVQYVTAAREADIRATASASSRVLSTTEAGEPLKVLEHEGEWFRVKPLDDPEPVTGWVTAASVQPASFGGTANYEELFRRLSEMATDIKDKYQKNPYMRVSGFTVEIGIPPSVSVDFEFK